MSRCIVVDVNFNGGDIHNLQFGGDGYRLFPDAPGRRLTSIEYNYGVSDLEEIKIVNAGPHSVILSDDSQSGNAGNKLYLPDSPADVILQPGIPYWLVYNEQGPRGAGWYGEGGDGLSQWTEKATTSNASLDGEDSWVEVVQLPLTTEGGKVFRITGCVIVGTFDITITGAQARLAINTGPLTAFAPVGATATMLLLQGSATTIAAVVSIPSGSPLAISAALQVDPSGTGNINIAPGSWLRVEEISGDLFIAPP